MAASFASGVDYPTWKWPDDIHANHDSSPPHSETSQDESTSGEDRPNHNEHAQHAQDTEPDASAEPGAQTRQRYWKPRTCRICLETVNPTYHGPGDGMSSLPGILRGGARVTYESEGGRLLRPCKCKGSSRYVHESCLQEWRHADPAYGTRNFWQCPTCGFRYRLERMQWGRWISSTVTQIALTLAIFLAAVFLLGFVADPIINLYVDPIYTFTTSGRRENLGFFADDDDDAGIESWLDHFLKGLASLGLLGFVKVAFSMSPIAFPNFRSSGIFGGGGRAARAGATGRDRIASMSWIVLFLGIVTFLWTVWKSVRAWSRRALEKAGERVMDVQGDEFDDDDEGDAAADNGGGNGTGTKTHDVG